MHVLATYDAVGARFRGLWGQEAGWAHSVLFTADLRAFSERLVEKKEEKEVEVKIEGSEEVMDERVTEVVEKAIKREGENDEEKVLEVEGKFNRRPKRRRRV